MVTDQVYFVGHKDQHVWVMNLGGLSYSALGIEATEQMLGGMWPEFRDHARPGSRWALTAGADPEMLVWGAGCWRMELEHRQVDHRDCMRGISEEEAQRLMGFGTCGIPIKIVEAGLSSCADYATW